MAKLRIKLGSVMAGLMAGMSASVKQADEPA